MYQNFEPTTDPKTSAPRLKDLRAQMKEQALDAFLVPHEDEFLGEYVPSCSERLKWLTSFDGSAGLAVILAEQAVLFVDGRYILQAPLQTDKACFDIINSQQTPPTKWLKDNLPPQADFVLGFDPRLHSIAQIEKLEKALQDKNITLQAVDRNPLDIVWRDRPAPPNYPATHHPDACAGLSSAEKRANIAATLKEQSLDAALLTQAESIAWLLNIRGCDVPHTPLALSFALLKQNGDCDWYIEPSRVSASLLAHIGAGVRVFAPAKMAEHLRALHKKRVLLDPARAPLWFKTHLGGNFIGGTDPCLLPKACKTKAEIDGAKAAHIRDGAALCRFLCWFESEAPKGQLSEISAAQKLEAYRDATGLLRDLSFDTISSTGAHGAIIHYRATHKTNRTIQAGDIYLVDSGGQYEDGTTDVTRTVLVDGASPPAGALTAFTYVLKGHIALAAARFPQDTKGAALDSLARAPLWAAGLDFAHGTGHGVGSYLSVHEGPQQISKHGQTALQPGMIVSNEPGYYRAGAYGIRIENLQYVTQAEKIEGGEQDMLGFETLTLAPIDKRLIDEKLLTAQERAWLNSYHARVYQTLAALAEPYMDKTTAQWLARTCEAI